VLITHGRGPSDSGRVRQFMFSELKVYLHSVVQQVAYQFVIADLFLFLLQVDLITYVTLASCRLACDGEIKLTCTHLTYYL